MFEFEVLYQSDSPRVDLILITHTFQQKEHKKDKQTGRQRYVALLAALSHIP